jgi:hypothetical protein
MDLVVSSLDEEKTLRLAEWRDVEVTVRGIGPDHGVANVALLVFPARSSIAMPLVRESVPPGDATGLRSLRSALAPGTYSLEVESLLYSGAAEITVADLDDLQRFEIWAGAR